MQMTRVVLISVVWISSALAQDRLPIIDTHLHASSVSDFGGPMAVCTNEQGVHFPGLDPREPITVERASVCDAPLMSAATDADLITETMAMLDRYNIFDDTSESPLSLVQ